MFHGLAGSAPTRSSDAATNSPPPHSWRSSSRTATTCPSKCSAGSSASSGRRSSTSSPCWFGTSRTGSWTTSSTSASRCPRRRTRTCGPRSARTTAGTGRWARPRTPCACSSMMRAGPTRASGPPSASEPRSTGSRSSSKPLCTSRRKKTWTRYPPLLPPRTIRRAPASNLPSSARTVVGSCWQAPPLRYRLERGFGKYGRRGQQDLCRVAPEDRPQGVQEVHPRRGRGLVREAVDEGPGGQRSGSAESAASTRQRTRASRARAAT
jgi:hypothetical protein